jgi:hypothetical protein
MSDAIEIHTRSRHGRTSIIRRQASRSAPSDYSAFDLFSSRACSAWSVPAVRRREHDPLMGPDRGTESACIYDAVQNRFLTSVQCHSRMTITRNRCSRSTLPGIRKCCCLEAIAPSAPVASNSDFVTVIRSWMSVIQRWAIDRARIVRYGAMSQALESGKNFNLNSANTNEDHGT